MYLRSALSLKANELPFSGRETGAILAHLVPTQAKKPFEVYAFAFEAYTAVQKRLRQIKVSFGQSGIAVASIRSNVETP